MPTEELYGSYHFLLEIQGVINDNKIIKLHNCQTVLRYNCKDATKTTTMS